MGSRAVVQGSSWHPTPWSVDMALISSGCRTGSCRAMPVREVGTALDSVSARPWLAKGPQIPCGPHGPPNTARALIAPRRERFLPTSLSKRASLPGEPRVFQRLGRADPGG